MRVVVVGATGNVGTSVIQTLVDDDRVREIVGVARRRPTWDPSKTTWVAADITRDDLVPTLSGADAVVHLAWKIQPSHRPNELWETNVEGSARLFQACVDAEVRAVVYASSVGAYSPGPKDRAVDESWPTHSVGSSQYGVHKAYVERLLDTFELRYPSVRWVRIRPALIFKADAASEIRRIFLGPLVRGPLIRPGTVPAIPRVARLRTQALHSLDAAEAYRLAVCSDVRGAFNIAAEPIIDADLLQEVFGARGVPAPEGVLRAAVTLSWRLRLQPTEPGWLDLALAVPLLDTTRARTELGWQPRRSAREALEELLEGFRDRGGMPTPPLVADGEAARTVTG